MFIIDNSSIAPHEIQYGTNLNYTSSLIDQNREEHRKRFEELIQYTMKTAKSYYETNRKINIIIVIVGLICLADSILNLWTEYIV